MTQPRWALSLLKMRCLSPTRDRSTGEKRFKPIFGDLFKNVHVIEHWVQADPTTVLVLAPDKMWCNGNWCMTFELPNGKRMAEEGFWSAVEVKDGDTWKHQLLTFNVIPK